nr:hypothetical protein [Cytophagales bacterium]
MSNGRGVQYVCILVLLLVFFALPHRGYGQRQPDGEGLLTFSHPSIGQYYIGVVFFGDDAYLPLGEILSLTEIPSTPSTNKFGLQGFYPSPKETWMVDPVAGVLILQGVSEPLPADDFYLGEQELYLEPSYFSKIFGLEFSVNPFNLSMTMKSRNVLPIDEKRKRETLRKQIQSKGSGQDALEMRYPLERKIVGLGVLDYNLNVDNSSRKSSFGLQMRAGAEILGGDFQVNMNGSKNNVGQTVNLSGMRWRYVLPSGLAPERNALLSSVTLGQISTSSQTFSAQLTGVALSNNPLIPRRELDVFVVDGYTEKDSEVELLIGGQLIDFMRADEVGYYRFNAPVTYGTLRLTLRIYTPQGEIITQEKQLQIPFTFLPKGFVSYNFQGGKLMNAPDSLASDLLGHADFSVGVTNAVTVRAGFDYGDYVGVDRTRSSFGISTRLFQQYLLDVDYLPSKFYRVNASVFYANNITISAKTTDYFTQPQEVNGGTKPLGDGNLNVFVPFQLFGKFSGIRIGGENIWLQDGYKGNLQADFNYQFGRVATRFNYRAQVMGLRVTDNLSPEFTPGILLSSMTYSLPRSPILPVFIKGMFFRAQAAYNTQTSQLSTVNVEVSQTLFTSGRFTLSYDRNIVNKSGAIQIGFLYDFNFIRSASQFTGRKGDYSIRQSLSGSLALDNQSGKLLPSNREQVNRSGISVRMFVDQNENGVFDEGEAIIPAKGIRLDKSANMVLGSDGILRITQLQSYWVYRLEVNEDALPDITLAPKEKVIGFMADPNRVKSIDIPLYRTGVIMGSIQTETAEGLQGVGGLRITLQRMGDEEPLETIRTFSDGGYYAFGLLPGKYTLEIDPKQLEYMKVSATPSILEFEIKALADGDYVEGLDFLLKRKE